MIIRDVLWVVIKEPQIAICSKRRALVIVSHASLSNHHRAPLFISFFLPSKGFKEKFERVVPGWIKTAKSLISSCDWSIGCFRHAQPPFSAGSFS